MMTDDMELVRDYAATQSESAFATLVARHIDLVYSSALRQTNNPHQAEEITQAVFIILARKSPSLGRGTILPAWLYRTTRFAAANARRVEINRQRREEEAHMDFLHQTAADSDTAWQQLAPVLDEAMAQLGENDRAAVVLRFFENKNLQDVANALGIEERAAQKRVSRAVEKLRGIFSKRGLTLSATILGAAISTHSIQAAPPALAKTVSFAVLTNGAAAGSSTLTLIKGTLKIMAWTKLKVAVVVGAAVLLAGGTTAIVVQKNQQSFPPAEGYWSVADLDKAPRILVIRPTRFPNRGGWVSKEDRKMGHNLTIESLMLAAYGASDARTIYPPRLPKGNFDFLVNLLEGNTEKFQEELKKQFGLVGRWENREAKVLLLKVKTPGATGLKKSPEHSSSSLSNVGGGLIMKKMPMDMVTGRLQTALNQIVVDKTGLNDKYDIDFHWQEGDERSLKQALTEQLGLELVPGRESVEMFVIEHVKK